MAELGDSTASGIEDIGLRYSNYRIEKSVGSDGYGKMYRAYDEVLDRPAALKVLFSGISEHEDLVSHFRKKVQDLAQVTHPCIPQVYFFGREGKTYFVALEWCSGVSLSNELRRVGRLQLQQATGILLQCIEGLAAAWKAGIVHGNLKPNNVMMDESREIKITDFGFVTERRSEVDVQSLAGAISFMAPELVDRRPFDFRADIYSLGIIFHYMLLNSLPSFGPGDTSRDFLAPEVRRVIEKMTAEDPQDRYADYSELAGDIEKLAVSSPDEQMPAVPRATQVGATPTWRSDSLFDLLADLFRETATGILKLSWLGLKKQFLVRRGEIVFFESSQPSESLSALITSKNWLSPSDLSAMKPDPEAMIRRVLMNRACTSDQLRSDFLGFMKGALFQTFLWPVLQVEFFPCTIENEPLATLRLSDVLLESARKVIDSNWVKERVAMDSLISRTPAFEQRLAPFPLSPEESFLAYRCEGDDLKLDTLGALTGLPDEKILRMTYLLQRIGAVELRPAAPRPQRPVAMKVPAQQAPRTVAPPPQPQPVVPAQAPAPPARPQAPPAAAARAEKGSPGPAPLRKDVPVPGKAKTPESRPGIAQELFAKAELEYEAGNYGKAAHLCKDAIQNHPAAEYYHLLGAAYAHHPRFQRDAEEAFHKAISLAPTQPDYHAVLAVFYSQRDLWIRARTHCQRALELAAGHKMANTVYQKVLDKKPGKGDCWCVWRDVKPAE